MTVTNITSELLQKHIIEEFAPQDPIKSPGRTPMLLRICSTSPVVLGIYISRMCLYGVVCDLSLQLLARAKRPLTPIENEESFLQKLRELAEQLTEHTERPILGMGISTVGVISSDASLCHRFLRHPFAKSARRASAVFPFSDYCLQRYARVRPVRTLLWRRQGRRQLSLYGHYRGAWRGAGITS